ncbi:MAG: sulfatase-like hydrolase/transferase [Rhodospirillales bacterium]|nr:sulfatase-like hydrolase/transferase [Rhodospirillales bacterium]
MEPANLIFFLSDNHTRRMMGAYGHPIVQTPNLDKIAARGVRFDNAYCASPLCCPSRSSLATGRYPHQTGYWDNALTYDGDTPSWHHRLRTQGHAVTAIGKLHFRSGDDDNGFTEEIEPLHIVNGQGALIHLLRATGEGVPPRTSHFEVYSKAGVGEADYQSYDRNITGHAIKWLNENAKKHGKPWVLLVSYASPHPPFAVPKRFYDLYPPDEMKLPVQCTADTRPDHPAVAHIRDINGFEDAPNEEFIRRNIAGYCGLVTHLDEQIGEVMQTADQLGLLPSTRVLYTSDHGEAAGNHGLFGKAVMYEHSIGVPLIAAGPDIPAGASSKQIVSHVDLFQTIVQSVGAELTEEDGSLPGISLWPAIQGHDTERLGFAEFHAQASRVASFALRDGDHKLVCHVGEVPQLFDLRQDPEETNDLMRGDQIPEIAAKLIAKLRTLVNPEEADQQAKEDQRRQMAHHGGPEAMLNAGTFAMSPIPGKDVEIESLT